MSLYVLKDTFVRVSDHCVGQERCKDSLQISSNKQDDKEVTSATGHVKAAGLGVVDTVPIDKSDPLICIHIWWNLDW